MQYLLRAIFILFALMCAGCVTTKATTPLTSEKGIKNEIFFYPSEILNSPAVVILPGRSNNAEAYYTFASKMQKSNINVIIVKYNFNGSSHWNHKLSTKRGGTQDLVANEVTTALNYLKAQQYVDKNKIGVLGGSMGTWVGLQTMSEFKELKALAMLSPMCAVEGKWFKTFSGMQKLAEDFGERHLFLIGSEKDKHSSKFPSATEKSEYLISIMPKAKIAKKYYPGKSHSYFMFRDHRELEALLIQWFLDVL